MIIHHCEHGDFSRWVDEVLGDPPLAAAIARTELAARSGAVSPAQARAELSGAIRQRYPDLLRPAMSQASQ